MKMPRRPKKSASFPPVSIRTAKVARTRSQPIELGEADAEVRWIDGSATFTIVLSSMIMKSPNETAASVHHLRFSGAKCRLVHEGNSSVITGERKQGVNHTSRTSSRAKPSAGATTEPVRA